MLYDADDVMLFRVVLEKVKHCQSVAETTVDVTQPPISTDPCWWVVVRWSYATLFGVVSDHPCDLNTAVTHKLQPSGIKTWKIQWNAGLFTPSTFRKLASTVA